MRSSIRLSGLCMLLAVCACQPSAPVADNAPDRATTATPDAPPPAPNAAVPATGKTAAAHWQCGEVLLDARPDGDAMRLDFSGRSLQLPHVESLTGARYADAAGNEFMLAGDSGVLILAGEDQRDCSRSTRTSPWIEAAARGIGFRAVGSEPGWFVEVGRGEAPPMHATLDYGDRRIEVAKTQPADLGYTGERANGTHVALKIQRTPCQDGMSGEAFEATVQLIVGDRTYRGCGAFLSD